MTDELNSRIISRGKELFSAIGGEKPSLFNKGEWVGKIMDWSMKNERFKTQMFRFVDTFPTLTSGRLLADHIREYFGTGEDMPPVVSLGADVAGMLGSLGGTLLNRAISSNIHEMARRFIVGETGRETVRNLEKLRRDGFAFVVDVLGEATLSEEDAEAYVNTYLDLLDSLHREEGRWKGLPGKGGDPGLDWGHAPKINVAVKATALYCLANPMNFEGSVVAILDRLRRIFARVAAVNGFLCLDMESYRFKEMVLEVFRRLRLEQRDYPHLGVALQSYLKDTDNDLDDLLAWARLNGVRLSIRLVKGAYWDYETVIARQNNREVPVWTIKAETDAAYERQALRILKNHDICHFACASHNLRTIAAVMEMAADLGVPEERYEFQLLYGMAEPVRRAILTAAGRVRLYSPYGEMVPGMGYLVRRLLENTANESFLRQTFAEGARVDKLLEDPVLTAERERGVREAKPKRVRTGGGGLPPFENEPQADFTRKEQREAFPRHIAEVRSRSGMSYPLFINGRDVTTDDLLPSVNPAIPSEVIGKVCQAGVREVEEAISVASGAFPAWRDTAPAVRADYLLKAAQAVRRRIFELSAWQVLEIGKQWDQAYADVTEAIEFLEYYAREMVRLGGERRVGHAPGELNHYFYEGRGVDAVIAPLNFPLAISTGMVSAAIVAGNCVVYKPSGLTSIIGRHLAEVFSEAGLPAGVFNYTPGRSSVMGDFLVDHPQISLIAFTGSKEVGLRIIERAAKVHPGQEKVKKVVCEMGGKNGIIIDDDADLDEAVPHVLSSAFAFQGQKCSACSRVIVLDGVYDRFVKRLLSLARAASVGPAENPACYMGAVADDKAMKRITEYIEIGGKEGAILYQSPVPAEGNFVPMTIIGGIRPEHRIAREEIFGPVLAVMRAMDFDQAVEWANATDYALTGGVFSRSPGHLDKARREFRVGNLYLNRGCTGALVERQPFGGSRMSGVGAKAGGADYLLHFMEPRVVTENTMRRGFAPTNEGMSGAEQ